MLCQWLMWNKNTEFFSNPNSYTDCAAAAWWMWILCRPGKLVCELIRQREPHRAPPTVKVPCFRRACGPGWTQAAGRSPCLRWHCPGPRATSGFWSTTWWVVAWRSPTACSPVGPSFAPLWGPTTPTCVSLSKVCALTRLYRAIDDKIPAVSILTKIGTMRHWSYLRNHLYIYN